jgi:hypothetical protein
MAFFMPVPVRNKQGFSYNLGSKINGMLFVRLPF